MTDVHYTPAWEDEAAQCKNCKSFQSRNSQNACVPPDKTFEEAIEAYGEVSPIGHCDYFQPK
ncbi:MAG: hypothetical protein PHW31_00390 [Candidatus Pacebacteria bacterium]|nr:hypothetical protein [Candidatus Paceibacterota bacterium]